MKEYICESNVTVICDLIPAFNENYYFLKIPIVIWLRNNNIKYLHSHLDNPNQIKFYNAVDQITFKLLFC